MADITVDNGALSDFKLKSRTGESSAELQGVELGLVASGPVTKWVPKEEDTAHASGDAGIPMMVVRQDTPSALAGDGDYIIPTADSEGKVRVAAGAAVRTSDSVSAALAVDRLMNNLTAVTPTSVAIAAASSGDNTLLAAQGSGNIIVVHQVLLVAASAVTVRFESGAGGTALTGQMAIAANQGFVLPFSPIGWFRTAANALLNLELSSAVSCAGVFSYTVVT